MNFGRLRNCSLKIDFDICQHFKKTTNFPVILIYKNYLFLLKLFSFKDEVSSTSLPITSTTVNVTTNSTNLTSTNDLTNTIVPIAVICAMLFTVTLVAFLFRRRICKYRNKINKDDMVRFFKIHPLTCYELF